MAKFHQSKADVARVNLRRAAVSRRVALKHDRKSIEEELSREFDVTTHTIGDDIDYVVRAAAMSAAWLQPVIENVIREQADACLVAIARSEDRLTLFEERLYGAAAEAVATKKRIAALGAPEAREPKATRDERNAHASWLHDCESAVSRWGRDARAEQATGLAERESYRRLTGADAPMRLKVFEGEQAELDSEVKRLAALYGKSEHEIRARLEAPREGPAN